ncbi:hypothetical protein ACIP93_24250 [Streptomyces sp. NPDC088745]|uniref:hypothetical protein n=1 Tax=Streptomyces sp. NPDC088745 TaxID=3365884 RepID=UPI003814CDA8
MQRALVGAVLGGALVLGGTATTAQADAPARASAGEKSVALKASWHFYKAHWTRSECENRGKALGGRYKCTSGIGHDGEFKWFLYRWY